MKQIVIAMFIAVIIAAIPTHKANADSQVISLLKSLPKQSVTDCTPDQLMDLLDDASLEWVESIECKYINLNPTYAGVIIGSNTTGENSSYIKFNFKKEKLMKMYTLWAFGAGMDVETTKVEIYLNDTMIKEGEWGYYTTSSQQDIDKIFTAITKGSGMPPYFTYTSDKSESKAAYSIKVSIPYQSVADNCRFYGFRIYYDGTVDASELESGSSTEEEDDIPTIVEEIEHSAQSTVEYYDIFGRRLPQKPNSGLYIRRIGAKTEKLLAR